MLSDGVVLWLIFWIPSIVVGCMGGALLAPTKGRHATEGCLLGLLLGVVGLLLEILLPDAREVATDPLRKPPPALQVLAEVRRRTGLRVFGGLAVLTGLEYIAAVSLDKNVPVLICFALPKAALIIWYFMHLRRVWAIEPH
jgi:hypothetical protein